MHVYDTNCIILQFFCLFFGTWKPLDIVCVLRKEEHNEIKISSSVIHERKKVSHTGLKRHESEWIINVEQYVHFTLLTKDRECFCNANSRRRKMSNGGLPWILKDANGLYTSAVQCRIPKYGDEALYLVLSRGRERERVRGKTTYWQSIEFAKKKGWLHLTFFVCVFWKAFSCQSLQLAEYFIRITWGMYLLISLYDV